MVGILVLNKMALDAPHLTDPPLKTEQGHPEHWVTLTIEV